MDLLVLVQMLDANAQPKVEIQFLQGGEEFVVAGRITESSSLQHLFSVETDSATHVQLPLFLMDSVARQFSALNGSVQATLAGLAMTEYAKATGQRSVGKLLKRFPGLVFWQAPD